MDKHLQIPGPGISVFRDREVPRLAGSSCHQHRWYFVLSQGCHVRLRTSAVNMRCGDGLFIIPPSCPVSCLEFIEGFSGYALAVDSSIAPAVGLPGDQPVPFNALACPYSRPEYRDMLRLSLYFKLMEVTFGQTPHFYLADEVKHLCSAFVHACKVNSHSVEPYVIGARTSSLSDRFIGLVERHCESERKLGFYARELGITAKYLSAVVSESTGNPAGRWIGEYAVWHAKRLLSERGMAVGEVASRMGFSHMSAFSKYFKRFAGVSPKEFKRSCPPG